MYKVCIYKGVSNSSRTVLVKRSLLTLDVKFLHHLQSTPLLHEYSGPSVSVMLGSIPASPFLEFCQVPAAIPLESLQWCRIFNPSSEASAWGRGKSHKGPGCHRTLSSVWSRAILNVLGGGGGGGNVVRLLGIFL